MTKSEKLEILSRVEEKCFTVLDNMDGPDLMSEEANRLLQNLENLIWLSDAIRPREDTPVEKSLEKTTETVEKSLGKVDTPAYTKADVKKILLNLQNAQGVDIAAVMSGMGYAKLSDIPEDKYAELVRRANSEVKK